MPAVFVHGNPETSAIWADLLAALRGREAGDLVTLSPPGFGAPVPAGFEATRLGYRDWLIGELEALGGGVDLVGHDWGGLHVYGVLAERPDLIRSWAADCAGILHPEYVWHEFATAWQTPELGETAITEMFGLPEEETLALLAGIGLPEAAVRALAPAMTAEMGACVLSLYRSAAQPEMAQLGERFGTTQRRPGLVLIPSEDPYPGTVEMCTSVAGRLGADTFALEGQGHWWMFESAAIAADALVAHWAKV